MLKASIDKLTSLLKLSDGNDGSWSSFNITVGTPPQPFRVLVSTKLSDVWVISQSPNRDVYLPNHNTTHGKADGGVSDGVGQYQLIDKIIAEVQIGDDGSDATRIGLVDNGNINSQGDSNLGFLGINDHCSDLGPHPDGQLSFLKSLKASGHIPSLSYAYSAGAWYRKVLGSLILGGYDKVRLMPDQLSLPISKNANRDLVVVLESVSLSDSAGSVKTLHSVPFEVFIDSTIPQLWLPEEVCSKFEDAFGLSWNSTVGGYLINDTHHESLRQENANVIFHLGNDESGETTINITLPYSAFDLELSLPFVSTKQYYFPLHRAAKGTQYVLGRTFLQEAYVSYDTN